jgi:hypothetical protein
MVKPHHQDLVSGALVSDAGGKHAACAWVLTVFTEPEQLLVVLVASH